MKIRYKAAGHVRDVPEFVGRRLVARGIAEPAGMAQAYETRDMRAASSAPVVFSAAYEVGLDAMDKAELHALAKERGVKVHHMAGADKVREALRAAQ